MKEIKKPNYCCHGKTLNHIQYENFQYCICCNDFINYEEKELLGKDSKLCMWCLMSKVMKELL